MTMLHDDGKNMAGETAVSHPVQSPGDVEEQSPGLENLQRIKQTWTPRGLAVAWVGAVLISFGVSYDTQMVGSLQPYATSSFAAAPLLGTIGVVQSVVESGALDTLEQIQAYLLTTWRGSDAESACQTCRCLWVRITHYSKYFINLTITI